MLDYFIFVYYFAHNRLLLLDDTMFNSPNKKLKPLILVKSGFKNRTRLKFKKITIT